jgi:hypothetical protein
VCPKWHPIPYKVLTMKSLGYHFRRNLNLWLIKCSTDVESSFDYPVAGEHFWNAGNVKLVVLLRFKKFGTYTLIFQTWFSLMENVSTPTEMSMNYNPHSHLHFLLQQDYFSAVANCSNSDPTSVIEDVKYHRLWLECSFTVII